MSPTILKPINIVFDNREKQLKPIIKEQIVFPPEPIKVMGIKVGEKKANIRYHRLWIEIIDCPSCIVVSDKSKLIVIKNGDSYKAELSDFTIENNLYTYEIYLDPNKIKDYDNFINNRQTIKFRCNKQYKKDGNITPKEYKVQLIFEETHSEPDFSFNILPEFKSGYEYRPECSTLLGSFEVKSKAPVNYSYPLNCTVHIKFDGPRSLEDTVYFDFNKIKEKFLFNTKTGDLKEEDEEIKSDAIAVKSLNKIVIKNLRPGILIIAPVCIDLKRIENPIDISTYTTTVSIVYTIKNRKAPPESITKKIDILRDPRKTEFFARIFEPTDRSINRRCISKSSCTLRHNTQWYKSDDQSMQCFIFELGNLAESEEGAVYIENFKMDFDYVKGSPSQMITANSKTLNDVFFVIDNDRNKPKATQYFPNQTNSKKNYSCQFALNSIEDIPDDIAKVECKISFDYIESKSIVKNIKDSNKRKAIFDKKRKQFTYNVRFQIERNLGPDWLALDFGTCAIVAAFGKNLSKEPLNLQRRLKEIVEARSFEGDEYTEENINEYGSRFLVSTTLLQNGNKIETKNYHEDIVLLAPTLTQVDQKFRYYVPFLKSLVGSDFIPNNNNNFDNFMYKLSDDDPKEILFVNEPIKTSSVLKNAYRSLIRGFIQPLISEQEKNKIKQRELNKIIITIPNLFTPRHVDLIKSLILDEFDIFKEDYISFISESDAVACYYVTLWNKLNKKRNTAEISKYRSEDEYVFVYDMGAGTLDLTYFRIRKKENGKKQVHIIGRLGKTTAGNYLDYIIAKYIFDQNENEFVDDMFGVTRQPNLMMVRLAFKDYIRNKIKPKLDSNDTITLKKDEFFAKTLFYLQNDIEINMTAVRNATEDFVKTNTKEIFDNFFTMFNKIENTKDSARKIGNFPIDTVILTGRSTQFNELKNAIINDLKIWSGTDNIYEIIPKSDSDLKNIVVQGALQFSLHCRGDMNPPKIEFVNRNLQARYGFIYIDPSDVGGGYRFKELLNPSTESLNEDAPHFANGITIFKYDTDKFDADPGNNKPNVIDLTNTVTGYFVQSYAKDTAKDWGEGKKDYISEIFAFDTAVVGKGPVEVRVVIDNNNEMMIHIGALINTKKDPLKIDFDNNPVVKKSLWPYFYSD